MSDYIDRLGLMLALTNSEVQRKIKAMNGNDAYNEFLCVVNFISKADVAPIEYAEWIPDEYAFNSCSKCGWEWDESEYRTLYCPNCGAKMEGIADE